MTPLTALFGSECFQCYECVEAVDTSVEVTPSSMMVVCSMCATTLLAAIVGGKGDGVIRTRDT